MQPPKQPPEYQRACEASSLACANFAWLVRRSNSPPLHTSQLLILLGYSICQACHYNLLTYSPIPHSSHSPLLIPDSGGSQAPFPPESGQERSSGLVQGPRWPLPCQAVSPDRLLFKVSIVPHTSSQLDKFSFPTQPKASSPLQLASLPLCTAFAKLAALYLLCPFCALCPFST